MATHYRGYFSVISVVRQVRVARAFPMPSLSDLASEVEP